MSNSVTALNGASFADGIARVDEVSLQGMITLRADLKDEAVQKALKPIADGDLPTVGTARITGDMGLAWMSPDEMLVLCDYATVDETLARLTKALDGVNALAVNVSDARASFRIKGDHARDALGKLCPVDFSHDGFPQDMFRRTRMAQVPAAVWMCDDDTLQVICFRSQARYVFDLLCVAAQPGSEVGVYVGV